MTRRSRQLVMYSAGATAWHALTHATFAARRIEQPRESFGIRLTPARHWAAAGFLAALSLLLTRVATKGEPPDRRSSDFAPSMRGML